MKKILFFIFALSCFISCKTTLSNYENFDTSVLQQNVIYDDTIKLSRDSLMTFCTHENIQSYNLSDWVPSYNRSVDNDLNIIKYVTVVNDTTYILTNDSDDKYRIIKRKLIKKK